MPQQGTQAVVADYLAKNRPPVQPVAPRGLHLQPLQHGGETIILCPYLCVMTAVLPAAGRSGARSRRTRPAPNAPQHGRHDGRAVPCDPILDQGDFQGEEQLKSITKQKSCTNSNPPNYSQHLALLPKAL